MQNNILRRQEIVATFREVGILPGFFARAASLRAVSDPADDGAIPWTLTTELPAVVWDWERWEFVNEVLVADGMMIPAIGQVPLQDSHNRRSAFDQIGHVREFSEIVVGSYPARAGMVYFAADENPQILRQRVLDGHITDGSVGYQVSKSIWIMEGMTVSYNGRSYAGPLKLSTEWSLKEFSITPIGADVLAKVRRLCGGSPRR